jgi:hypothetical protein
VAVASVAVVERLAGTRTVHLVALADAELAGEVDMPVLAAMCNEAAEPVVAAEVVDTLAAVDVAVVEAQKTARAAADVVVDLPDDTVRLIAYSDIQAAVPVGTGASAGCCNGSVVVVAVVEATQRTAAAHTADSLDPKAPVHVLAEA